MVSSHPYFLAIFTFFCQLDHSRDSPRSGDFGDLTFHLSEVLNDITGIAKHYWMNVMIDLALAQSDRFICSGGVKNFLYVHSCVRFGSGAQLQLVANVSEPDTSQTVKLVCTDLMESFVFTCFCS